jgi:glutamate racemase
MLDAGADTLVLGCTHYPFLDRAIREIAGERLHIVDTSVAVARQLERLLDASGLRNADASVAATPLFYSTADGEPQRQLAASLLQIQADVRHVVIPTA